MLGVGDVILTQRGEVTLVKKINNGWIGTCSDGENYFTEQELLSECKPEAAGDRKRKHKQLNANEQENNSARDPAITGNFRPEIIK
jgi:hypothetical protein